MNVFSRQTPDTPDQLPSLEAWMAQAPIPVWEGHDDAVACHRHSWEMLHAKLHSPEPGSGFTRNYIYTPFRSSVFVWGTCFISMFAKYLSGVFSFPGMLENFYGAQDDDGFIPRQLHIHDGRSEFPKDDPDSVGGDIFSWAEREWARFSGDTSRFASAHPVLLRYHRWIREHRTRPDGSYFASGWGCGMDNIPRFDTERFNLVHSPADISWVDVTLQQLFDAKNLLAMAEAAGIEEGRDELRVEADALGRLVNGRMWSEADGLYEDLDAAGRPTGVRHVGAFWALLAGVAPPARARRLAEALFDPATFAAATGTASLAADHPGFVADGGNYWQGGVWCIMDYMVAKGLRTAGLGAEAHRVARRSVEAVARVHAKTGTVWESYSPTADEPGKCYGETVRRDFVGFSGVTPIALLLEEVLGIDATVERIVWDVRLTERHGVRNLRLPDGTVVDLLCEARRSPDETPRVTMRSSRPIPLEFSPGFPENG